MKCKLCGLEVALCDHPVFEYIGKKKRWYHECCMRHKYPCRQLLKHLINRNKEVPSEQDP